RVVGHGRFADLVHDAASAPLLRDNGTLNILSARVVSHEPAEGVSVVRLDVPGDGAPRLVVPAFGSPPGEAVLFAGAPWDVALASGPVEHVSIRNQVRGVVKRCTPLERSVLVEADIGVPLVAEVSMRSVVSLGLTPGRPVVCLIKSNAIRQIGVG